MGDSTKNISWQVGPVFVNNLENKIKNTFSTINDKPVAQQVSNKNTIVNADSGASKHFIKTTDKHLLTNISNTTDTSVVLPNKDTLVMNESGQL